MSLVVSCLITRRQTFVQLFSCSSFVAKKLRMSFPSILSLILNAKSPAPARIIFAVASGIQVPRYSGGTEGPIDFVDEFIIFQRIAVEGRYFEARDLVILG